MEKRDLILLSETFSLAMKFVSQNNDLLGMKKDLSSMIILEGKLMPYLESKMEEDKMEVELKKDGKNNK